MLGLYVTVPIACWRRGYAREYLETELIPTPSTCYGFLLSLVGETDRDRHVGCRVTAGRIGEPDMSVVLRKVWRVKTRNGWKTPEGEWLILGDAEQKAFNRWLASELCSGMDTSSDSIPERFDWCQQLLVWHGAGRPDVKKADLDSIKKGRPKEQVKAIGKWISANSEFTPVLGSGENTRPDYQQLLSGAKLVIWLDSETEANEADSSLEDRVRGALNDPSGVTRFGGLSLGESTHLVDEVCLLEKRLDSLTDADNLEMFLLADHGRLTLPVWVDHVGSAGTRYATGDLTPASFTPPAAQQLPQISKN